MRANAGLNIPRNTGGVGRTRTFAIMDPLEILFRVYYMPRDPIGVAMRILISIAAAVIITAFPARGEWYGPGEKLPRSGMGDFSL